MSKFGQRVRACRNAMASPLLHAVVALSYVAGGVGVALVAPSVVASSLDVMALLSGGMFIIAGGLVHEVWARRRRDRKLARRFAHLNAIADGLEERLVSADQELIVLRRGLESLVPESDGGFNLEALLSEVRQLRADLNEMSVRVSSESPPRSAPKPSRLRDLNRSSGLAVSTMREAESSILLFEPTTGTNGAVPHRTPLDETQILEAIRDALHHDRVDFCLQPIVVLPQRKPRYYEVFSRVCMADGTHLMPQQFLHVARNRNLIAAIDNLLLIRCVQMVRESDRVNHDVGFFANLSIASLNDVDFMKRFLRVMAHNQPLRSRLVFEVGQAALKAGGANTAAVFKQLVRIGFRFSLDQVENPEAIDVETLTTYGFRYLKLDCARLLEPGRRRRLEEFRRRLAKESIDLIVEKVETEAQLVEVMELHIDYGQGFLFGEPRLARKLSSAQ
ncbi:cyclic-di-GMP phosphodiesterase, flagellum assembly factor TipF [Azospirillaceae bacterium]